MDEESPSLLVFIFYFYFLARTYAANLKLQGAEKVLRISTGNTVLKSHKFVSDWKMVGFKAYFLI